MSKTIDLNIPRTAAERLAKEADGIWGLIKRIQARASDGRFYAMGDDDREKAIVYLKKHASTYSSASALSPDLKASQRPTVSSETDPLEGKVAK